MDTNVWKVTGRVSVMNEHLLCQPIDPEIDPSCRQLLPKAGWEQKKAPDGEVYYVNHTTKVTSWERPVAAAVKDSSPVTSPPPAPATSKPKGEQLDSVLEGA